MARDSKRYADLAHAVGSFRADIDEDFLIHLIQGSNRQLTRALVIPKAKCNVTQWPHLPEQWHYNHEDIITAVERPSAQLAIRAAQAEIQVFLKDPANYKKPLIAQADHNAAPMWRYLNPQGIPYNAQ